MEQHSEMLSQALQLVEDIERKLAETNEANVVEIELRKLQMKLREVSGKLEKADRTSEFLRWLAHLAEIAAILQTMIICRRVILARWPVYRCSWMIKN